MLSTPELRLECLKLAMAFPVGKAEVATGNIDGVVEISTRLYNHVIEGSDALKEPPTDPTKTSGPSRQKVDKSPEIFK